LATHGAPLIHELNAPALKPAYLSILVVSSSISLSLKGAEVYPCQSIKTQTTKKRFQINKSTTSWMREQW